VSYKVEVVIVFISVIVTWERFEQWLK